MNASNSTFYLDNIKLGLNFIKNGNSDEFFVIEGKAGTGKTTIAEKIIKQFIPIINSESKISIRLIDHFITKYAKSNKVTYKINENNGIFTLTKKPNNELTEFRRINTGDKYNRYVNLYSKCNSFIDLDLNLDLDRY